jgi:hypothetical protein
MVLVSSTRSHASVLDRASELLLYTIVYLSVPCVVLSSGCVHRVDIMWGAIDCVPSSAGLQMVLVASTCSHACALDRGCQTEVVCTASVTCLLGMLVTFCGLGLQCVIRAGLDIDPVNSTVAPVMLSNRLGLTAMNQSTWLCFGWTVYSVRTCCAPLAAAVQLYVSMCKEQCSTVCFLQKHCTHFRPHLDLRSEGRNF